MFIQMTVHNRITQTYTNLAQNADVTECV